MLLLPALLLAAAAQKPSPPPVGRVRLPPLSYTVERSGPPGGAHPKRSDTVTVRYRLTLLDGTEVDATAADGPPSRFPLNRLIPAWQVLVQLMRPGDAWTFFVPPKYGYGAVRRSEKLPPNSFLVFRVELLATEAGEEPPPPPSPGRE